LVKLISQGFIV
jgi:hypothetical protein